MTISNHFLWNVSKCLNVERQPLGKKCKGFEKTGSFFSGNKDYIACKTKLNNIFDKKVEGLRTRRKWY